MLLIYCEINHILIWSSKIVITYDIAAYQATTFPITDTKLFYVPIVTLSIDDNAKLLHQLKSGCIN